jgi:subtilase family serine protease
LDIHKRSAFNFSSIFCASIILGATISTLNASEPAARIHASLDSAETFRLTGNTRVLPSVATDQGEADSSLALPRMTLHFSMSAAQQKDLENLITQQVDKRSSLYHHWLTPEQYAERFGVNSSDLQKVTAWLSRQGFSNVEVARTKSFVTFSGTAGQVQAAFQTPLHSFMVDGLAHYANVADPVLPKALEGMVLGIRGLTDFHPKPHLKPATLRPHFTSSISGNNFLTPNDWATIYNVQPLYGAGYTGAGQKIAIIGQSDINLTDLRNFRTAAGLPQNDPQIIVVGADPGARVRSGDQGESELDLEWAGGIAYNATIVFVNSADVFNSSLYYAIDQNVAPVLSITYGDCESDEGAANVSTLNTLFQMAAAEGITVLAAAGDSGAADCDTSLPATGGLAADFPGTSPYVTSIGGTTLSEGSGAYWSSTNNSNNGSALSYIPEVVWNDIASTSTLSAGGGGASNPSIGGFTKPSWQTGPGVPNDNARDVPDVSFAASPNHDPYLMCSGNGLTYCLNGGFRDASSDLDVVGGTSASTPSFAAVIALLNQKLGSSQGLINPNIYRLASVSTDAFHDIATGNNIVPCMAGSTSCPGAAPYQFGFSAGVGYDQATGWGSVDAYHMVSEWLADYEISLNPASLTLKRGTPGSATVTVADSNNFAGTVTFSCTVSGATNTTCSIPGSVTGSGTATLTITPAASAATPAWRSFKNFPRLGTPVLFATLAALVLCAVTFWLGGKNRKRMVSFAGAASIILVMASCGGGSSSSTTTSTLAPTLNLATSAAALTLGPGSSGTSTATITTGGSFSGSVALAVSGAPAGMTTTLASTSLNGSGTSTLTVGVGSTVVAGTYPLTITATGNGLTATASVNVTVATVTVTATSGSIVRTTTLNLTLN